MTKEQIDILLAEGYFPEQEEHPQLVETHISWVILCGRFAYKIKRPIKFSFVDFSTFEKRKFYCERELALNRRLSVDMYLDVLPVRESAGRYLIGGTDGVVIDHVVQMRRYNKNCEMDLMLIRNAVEPAAIISLADKIAHFHKGATKVLSGEMLDVQKEFNDLEGQIPFLSTALKGHPDQLISGVLEKANQFIALHKELLTRRKAAGFFRDGHGDLHTGNIFLLPAPQPFDCIEFNDALRRDDVLNEVAFLCMDLEVFGRDDLADLFLDRYNKTFPVMLDDDDRKLFNYYKSYRANIRAKVNSIRAHNTGNETEKNDCLKLTWKYLLLMQGCMEKL